VTGIRPRESSKRRWGAIEVAGGVSLAAQEVEAVADEQGLIGGRIYADGRRLFVLPG
jgi:hypothetical protein